MGKNIYVEGLNEVPVPMKDVEIVERMGAEADAHFALPGLPPIVARLPPDVPLRHGDRRFLLPAYPHAALFDPEGGERL